MVVLDHLSEIEKRAYILADNKLTDLSSFDDDLLRAELAELRDAEIDLAGLGFSDDELRVLLADAEATDATAVEEEQIPEPPVEPVTRAGDTWCIARHHLICGDCRDRDDVQRLFAGVKANLVITSPPYAAQRGLRHIEWLHAHPTREILGLVQKRRRQHRGGPRAGWQLFPEHQGACRRRRKKSVRDGPRYCAQAAVGLAIRG